MIVFGCPADGIDLFREDRRIGHKEVQITQKMKEEEIEDGSKLGVVEPRMDANER